jgi:ABC-type multidrug transport system fused ATPase/permease subunit
VDYETDRKIQDTIAHAFADRTILCIAHRLRTIIGYDRICVLDAGTIAEFDTPANLFAREGGIFRGMAERSSISAEDIRLAQRERLGV